MEDEEKSGEKDSDEESECDVSTDDLANFLKTRGLTKNDTTDNTPSSPRFHFTPPPWATPTAVPSKTNSAAPISTPHHRPGQPNVTSAHFQFKVPQFTIVHNLIYYSGHSITKSIAYAGFCAS